MRSNDPGVFNLPLVGGKVIALPYQAPPRRSSRYLPSDALGKPGLLFDADGVFVRRPYIVTEELRPPRVIDALLLRLIVVSRADRVRKREDVQEGGADRAPLGSRNDVARVSETGNRILDRNQRAARCFGLREVAIPLERCR